MIARKILLTGAPAVGKTSIIRRFVHNSFSEEYQRSSGIRIDTRHLQISGQELGLSIWDRGNGNNSLHEIDNGYLGASGILHVIDASNPDSYADLSQQYASFSRILPYVPLFIAVNKTDIDGFHLDPKIMEHIPQDHVFYTSAKYGVHLHELFISLGNELLKSYRQKTSFLNLF